MVVRAFFLIFLFSCTSCLNQEREKQKVLDKFTSWTGLEIDHDQCSVSKRILESGPFGGDTVKESIIVLSANAMNQLLIQLYDEHHVIEKKRIGSGFDSLPEPVSWEKIDDQLKFLDLNRKLGWVRQISIFPGDSSIVLAAVRFPSNFSRGVSPP